MAFTIITLIIKKLTLINHESLGINELLFNVFTTNYKVKNSFF